MNVFVYFTVAPTTHLPNDKMENYVLFARAELLREHSMIKFSPPPLLLCAGISSNARIVCLSLTFSENIKIKKINSYAILNFTNAHI